MCVTGYWISYIGAIHYIHVTPFLISGSVSDIQDLFIHLGLAVWDLREMALSYMSDGGLVAPLE